MLLAAVDGQMTTVLLAIVVMIVAGMFSRVLRVLATVCTLGFALFAALLAWQPGQPANAPPSLSTEPTIPLPDSDEAWRAVERRDPRFDGRFVYAVRSTRIYCRPSCPSRRPEPTSSSARTAATG